MKPLHLIKGTLLLGLCLQSLALSARELNATLDWQRPLTLGTPLSGLVAEVAAAPGQRVAEGDLLVALDQRLLRARLDQARASMDEAEALKAEADRELERAQELFDRTVLSIHELTLAEIDAARASAAARRAVAELAEAKLNLEYSAVRAPFDALVLEVPVHEGRVVVNQFQAEALVRLAPRQRISATAVIDVETATGLRVGQPLEVVWNGETYPGELSALAPNDAGGGFRLEVSVPVQDAGTVPRGGAAVIRLP